MPIQADTMIPALASIGAIVGVYTRIAGRLTKLEAKVQDEADELALVRGTLPGLWRVTNEILVSLARIEERMKAQEDHRI